MQQQMSKTAFAALIGVSPGRISQMIKAGQIGPEALSGEGQRAQIIVEIAQSHLKDRLDVDQRLGLNGLGTQLQQPAAPTADTAETQIKAEKLAQSKLVTEKMLRESRVASGFYIRADAARREMGKIASSMMAEFESALQPLANAVSAEFQLPHRDVVLSLKKAMREWQSGVAERLSLQAAAMDAVVADADEPAEA